MPKPKRLSSLGLYPENGNDPLINEIIFDSRRVKPGCLFAALKGVSVHGAKFVEAALEAGASAILTDQEGALNLKGIKIDTTEMSDKKFPEALVGPKTGNGVVLQLTGWKEGPFDATYEGCDRLCEKYTQNPKLKLIAGNQLKK